MADLFGEWVPDEWINEVFKACEAAPQHKYLFLTKNVQGYKNMVGADRENFWFGTTITGKNYSPYEVFSKTTCNAFLSIEPLFEDVGMLQPCYIDWVIIGAETGNRKDKIIPKKKWVESIARQCQQSKTPVFMKNSLAEIWGEPLLQEYPW